MSNTVKNCSRPTNLKWVELPDSLFQKAISLKRNTPAVLKETGGTVGCPDCRDQGTILFEIHKSSGNVDWKLDIDETRNPNSTFSQAIKDIDDILQILL